MKNKLSYKMSVVILGTLFLLSSSLKVVASKEERKVSDFKAISLSIPAVLQLTQGNENKVVIEGEDEVLEKIITEVEDGRLTIRFEKWYNYRGSSSLRVFVTVKQLEALLITGSGQITAQSSINADKIRLMVSGSGDIESSDLIAKKVDVMVTGSGDININGDNNAHYLKAVVTGSGDFDAGELTFENGDLTITGSGTINAGIEEELNAVITGSGKIYYKGNPLIDATITGSGKIRNNN